MAFQGLGSVGILHEGLGVQGVGHKGYNLGQASKDSWFRFGITALHSCVPQGLDGRDADVCFGLPKVTPASAEYK